MSITLADSALRARSLAVILVYRVAFGPRALNLDRSALIAEVTTQRITLEREHHLISL